VCNLTAVTFALLNGDDIYFIVKGQASRI